MDLTYFIAGEKSLLGAHTLSLDARTLGDAKAQKGRKKAMLDVAVGYDEE
jgi:hypothetical protein